MPTTRCLLLLPILAALLVPGSSALAQGPLGPLNDLGALGEGSGQTPDTVPTQRPAEPDPMPVPRAVCGPGAKPEPSIQGRVPAGAADNGLLCNTEMVSHQGTSGGFKVLRYTDTQGHTCAYYDTALLFPLNAFNLNASGLGVTVLDMTDPAHPVQTDTLTEIPMLSPHESLNLNPKRGLIAAVSGNPSTYPGDVSIYDAHADCRHPVHDFTGVIARFGHESGFSADGKTFYATGTAVKSITAIDVTDPSNPHPIWQGNELAHGMTLSDDGNRAYVADPTGGDLLILDTSQIQARKPDPQVREVSRLTWKRASIPQNAIPFTENGHPYVLEFDEYTAGTLGSGSGDDVGAARIIDIGDERAPRVVSNLRLQINQPADHAQYGNDPGAYGSEHGFVQGYAAHYCNIPTEVDPKFVACSFIASGLRLFDISDLKAPREAGYFVAPTKNKVENGFSDSSYAMSKPAFDVARHEVWYTDGTSGFYVVKVTNGAWPAAGTSTSTPAVACRTKRTFTVRLHHARGDAVRSVKVYVDGKRVQVHRRHGRREVTVNLRTKGRRVVTVRAAGVTRRGRHVQQTRRYRACRAG